MSDASTATLPQIAPAATAPQPGARFVLGWMAAWAGVGLAVALGIVFATGRDLRPILALSVLFSLVVGLTAFTSARYVFPLFEKLPFAFRVVLEVLTVVSGAIFGSAAVIWMQPLYIAAQFRTVALIVVVNAVLALIVGIALNTYDNMKRQIEQSYLALRDKEALERELGIAREVQQLLLPRAAPEVAGLELAGVCRAAVGVGGDFYDYLTVDDARLGLVIADVSGKGIPAALLMAGLQASLRSLCGSHPRAATLTGQLNQHLFDTSAAARYATLFLGFYDAERRMLSYSNAGHLPPLRLRGDEVVRLTEGGMPIGLFEQAHFCEGRLELQPGDVLALYTDGVVEAPGVDGEEFGDTRLIRTIAKHPGKPLGELIQHVLGDLERWSGQAMAHDDVTLLLARVR